MSATRLDSHVLPVITPAMYLAYRSAIRKHIQSVPEDKRRLRWRKDKRGWVIPEKEKAAVRFRAMFKAMFTP